MERRVPLLHINPNSPLPILLPPMSAKFPKFLKFIQSSPESLCHLPQPAPVSVASLASAQALFGGVAPDFPSGKEIFVGSCLFPGVHYHALSSADQKPSAVDSAWLTASLQHRALSPPKELLVSVTPEAKELLTQRLINFDLRLSV